jgi:hypothetical protein
MHKPSLTKADFIYLQSDNNAVFTLGWRINIIWSFEKFKTKENDKFIVLFAV